jgi:hypothetical protein
VFVSRTLQFCCVVYGCCYEGCDIAVNVIKCLLSRQLPIALGTYLQVTKSFSWSGTGDSVSVKKADIGKYRYVICN